MKIKKLLNQFFRDDCKPFSNTNFDQWIVHRDARNRLFGITPTKYRALNSTTKNTQRKASFEQFQRRFEIIFQRRHDCIHNCDRPKIALDTSNLNKSAIAKVIFDIVFLVARVEEAVIAEFPHWLNELGATGATRARVLK